MKREATRFRAFSSFALVMLLAVMSSPIASDGGRASTGEPDAAPRAVEPGPGPSAADAEDRAAIVRQQSHFRPRHRGLRRSHRPLSNADRILGKESVRREFKGARHEVLKFDEIPDYARKRYLREHGVLLTDYVGDRKYVAAVNDKGRGFLESATGITRAG